jgi:hypothetical protein
MNSYEPINFIWQTREGAETDFDYEYLTQIIFKNYISNSNIYFDNQSYKTILNNSIIIYANNSCCLSKEFINYINQFVDKGFSFSLIHTANESLGHNYTDYISKTKYLFRSYFDPRLASYKNIIYIPVGFKSGFYNNTFNISLEEKKYSLAFIGDPNKSDRMEMIKYFNNIKNTFKHTTRSWGCHTSLDTRSCVSIYQSSRFAPCPMGFVHADSFRIMESLESMCIPIIKKYNSFDYHTQVWGENNPIPKIDHWRELETLANISNEDYVNLYFSVFNWYKNKREKLGFLL